MKTSAVSLLALLALVPDALAGDPQTPTQLVCSAVPLPRQQYKTFVPSAPLRLGIPEVMTVSAGSKKEKHYVTQEYDLPEAGVRVMVNLSINSDKTQAIINLAYQEKEPEDDGSDKKKKKKKKKTDSEGNSYRVAATANPVKFELPTNTLDINQLNFNPPSVRFPGIQFECQLRKVRVPNPLVADGEAPVKDVPAEDSREATSGAGKGSARSKRPAK